MNRNTELSVDVSSSLNTKVIRLYDTSFYYGDEKVENYLIEVLPVNKDQWVTFLTRKGFSIVLNSSNLRYKVVKEADGLIDLPDGIYEIKQSYKPNTLTLNHFFYFRTTSLLVKIEEQRAKLLSNRCSLSKTEYTLNRDRLRDIEEYVWAAKWMIEEEGKKEEGKELYEFAKKSLEQYSNECQC